MDFVKLRNIDHHHDSAFPYEYSKMNFWLLYIASMHAPVSDYNTNVKVGSVATESTMHSSLSLSLSLSLSIYIYIYIYIYIIYIYIYIYIRGMQYERISLTSYKAS